jgi:hypothetical protein
MNLSAQRAGLPTFDGLELIRCINRLIQVDQEWVPHQKGSSLYIRPTLIGIDVSGTLLLIRVFSSLIFVLMFFICDPKKYNLPHKDFSSRIDFEKSAIPVLQINIR